MNHILKIGLVTLDEHGRLLVVKKHGGRTFILAGGKPEEDESDINALDRELREELGVSLAPGAKYMGSYGAVAADMPTHTVMVRAYRGEIVGQPRPQAEIEEVRWIDATNPDVPLAETITKGILPALRSK